MEEKKLTEEKAFTLSGITEWLSTKAKTDEDMYYVGAIAGTYLAVERQKAEIERLTEENGQLKGYNDGLEYEVEQRQKRVDELITEKEDLYFQNQNLQTYIDNHEAIWKRNAEQAVKDTAKEILGKANELWLDTINPNCLIDKIENWIKERYGVEVE